VSTKKTAHVLLLSAIIVFFVVSCNRDPWTYTSSPTDVVSITKTTKFIKQADDATPMKSQVGTVKMSHRVHEEHGVKCEVCHHKKGNDDRVKECAQCHKGYEGYATMHNLCLNCHIENKEGPLKCKNCH